jgi:hypothetical protein
MRGLTARGSSPRRPRPPQALRTWRHGVECQQRPGLHHCGAHPVRCTSLIRSDQKRRGHERHAGDATPTIPPATALQEAFAAHVPFGQQAVVELLALVRHASCTLSIAIDCSTWRHGTRAGTPPTMRAPMSCKRRGAGECHGAGCVGGAQLRHAQVHAHTKMPAHLHAARTGTRRRAMDPNKAQRGPVGPSRTGAAVHPARPPTSRSAAAATPSQRLCAATSHTWHPSLQCSCTGMHVPSPQVARPACLLLVAWSCTVPA